jgi:hypothetical protein
MLKVKYKKTLKLKVKYKGKVSVWKFGYSHIPWHSVLKPKDIDMNGNYRKVKQLDNCWEKCDMWKYHLLCGQN